VTSNIGEISAGIADIGGSIRKVAGFAEEVGAESVKLDTEVNCFQTACGDADDPERLDEPDVPA
jgi:hypothetical protein